MLQDSFYLFFGVSGGVSCLLFRPVLSVLFPARVGLCSVFGYFLLLLLFSPVGEDGGFFSPSRPRQSFVTPADVLASCELVNSCPRLLAG
jgi:hypothetical protein